MHIYIYINIYVYTYTYIYIYIYIEGLDPMAHIDVVWRKRQVVSQRCVECGAIYIHVYVRISVKDFFLIKCIYIHMCKFLHTHVYSQAQMHAHTHTHRRMHTFTHKSHTTHTHTLTGTTEEFAVALRRCMSGEAPGRISQQSALQ